MATPSQAAPRASNAAIARKRRRQRGGGSGSEGDSRPRTAGESVLCFYTENVSGWKLSAQGTLLLCTGFIAFVMLLHILGLFSRSQSSGQ